jgi:methylamine dehydrogenase accessory protein MauD
MSDALLVSHAVLWIVVVVLALVVLALVRQIGVLHERVAPAGALVGREGPRPGERADALEAEDLAGERVRVGGAEPSGASTLLLFVSPSCPVCKAVLPAARSLRDAAGGALRLVLASDGPREEHAAFVREQGLGGERYLLSAALGLLYQVGRLPHAVLIDAEGVVRARGLVNSREHLESLCEAQALGVASVQEYLAQRDGRGAKRVA